MESESIIWKELKMLLGSSCVRINNLSTARFAIRSIISIGILQV